MRGVIYARYSSDNQREESIEGQLRDCRSFLSIPEALKSSTLMSIGLCQPGAMTGRHSRR